MPHRTSTFGLVTTHHSALRIGAGVPMLFLGLLTACGDGLPTAHVDDEGRPVDADTVEVPITVTRTEPAAAEQGQTLDVNIYGEGFAADGASATWERDGVADTTIVVHGVTYVSETELVASITVALETDLGLYDVAVSRKRKKGVGSESISGVGSEIFTIEPYEPRPMGWLVESIWAGAYSAAYTVTDHGMVAGSAADAALDITAVYWTEGEEPVTFGGEESIALGSNDHGWIVGARGVANDLVSAIPFLFEDGVVRDLEPLQAPHRSHALDINDAGTIVGWGARDYWADPTWPIVWDRGDDGTYGAPVMLPLPDGQEWEIDDHQEGSRAAAINSRGDVVGTIRHGWGDAEGYRAVLWQRQDNGTYSAPIILGGGAGQARGINDAGWIVGSSYSNVNAPSAVVWRPDDYGTPIAFDPAAAWSDAVAINETGQIVGTRSASSNSIHAVLWALDTGGTLTEMVELAPPPDYTYAAALAINAHGWVVGVSQGYEPYRTMATLWRPED